MQIIRNRISYHIPRFGFKYLCDTTFLNEEHLQIQKVALDFAKEKMLPYASDWDKNNYLPSQVLKELSEMGFATIYVKQELGGVGLDHLSASVIFEALSYGDITTTATLAVQNLCAYLLANYGTEEQRKVWIPRINSFDALVAYCLTEPNSGSDNKNMETYAKKDGKDYIINGIKCFISGGSVSDLYLIVCKTSEKDVSSILVEKDTPGLSFGKVEDKMGWHASPTTRVILENVRVPQSNLVGKEGQGFKMGMSALDGGRINISSCSLGGASLALDLAKDYLQDRKQFGQQLSNFQGLQFKFADMAASLVTSRLIVRQAAMKLDENQIDKSLYVSMAKTYATDSCFDVANDALQLHGGYGYLREYQIERIVRDLRVHKILEGTNEIMRMIIARNLLK
ncbi:unnamed protein product (macronuclear) [Paramecium tetraurelia]|uniref:Isobutyryl-CoA dehydrogenase, mitochondrial n=1 Tax=Paramecium tetraurelia TaxID=5888 RepID=A0BJE0_PARTE|nr:uncharacterized protein GSPATT00005030001 [Paramecium tetraurelia]CAK58657.1 unnamed protein product [Paramecium tetraurelia]|eukprot:XP_001426055.1 hypothetical protein (macronuclear) [Paramecium tetraurelia strain d4-2]